MAALLRTLGVRNRTEAAYKAANLLDLTKLGPAEPSPGFDGPAASISKLTGGGLMSRADE